MNNAYTYLILFEDWGYDIIKIENFPKDYEGFVNRVREIDDMWYDVFASTYFRVILLKVNSKNLSVADVLRTKDILGDS